MEKNMNSCTIQIKTKMWNVCRCCLAANKYSLDNFSEYLSTGQSKAYKDLLMETLSIEISPESQIKTLMCNDCVLKLQQASAFKTMVKQSEQMFSVFLSSLLYGGDRHEERKIEGIKKDSTVDIDCENRCNEDWSSLEDEPMSVVKQEIKESPQTPEEKVNGNPEEQLEKDVKKKSNHMDPNLNKMRDLGGIIKSEKDWTKLTEQRGNGPILRENSLKLLENSTIFPFQWYKSKYTCFCCQEPFLSVDELRSHSTKHTMKDIERKIILQQNMLVKVEVSNLNCKLCSKPLEDLQKLREHLNSDHNFEFRLNEDLLVPFKIQQEAFECQLCSEKYNVFRLLNIHMNKHYQKQVCHICGAAFSNLKFLNLHKSRLHRRWNCKECNVEFSSKSEKRKHDLTVHKIKSVSKLRFPCPHCDERYYQESFRVLHLVETHGMRRPEYKCSVCPKTFITKSLCNNHFKAVHKKERKHSCDICNHQFYTKSDVARHRVTHTGEKKYSCALCNGPFATKDSLRRHMKRTHVAVN